MREKIIQYIRQRFHIPDSVKLTVGDFRESVYPDFYAITLTLDDGKDKKSQPFFAAKDGRYLVDGSIYTLGGDARKDIIQLISLADEATQGPATAPVTLVEYSDMECPVCARFHETLETDIIPKYPTSCVWFSRNFLLPPSTIGRSLRRSPHSAPIRSIPPGTFPTAPWSREPERARCGPYPRRAAPPGRGGRNR